CLPDQNGATGPVLWAYGLSRTVSSNTRVPVARRTGGSTSSHSAAGSGSGRASNRVKASCATATGRSGWTRVDPGGLGRAGHPGGGQQEVDVVLGTGTGRVHGRAFYRKRP